MKIIGIIVEYNPFHNGHLYHLNEAKKHGDLLVAVMAGNYTMRGEISPIDKWLKTEVALKYGIDLVIELPLVYVVQSADIFAYASIYLLNQLKVDEIYFGSETNNLNLLNHALKISETKEYNDSIKKYLALGYAYPKASMLAYQEFQLEPLKSGDLLNVSYLKAIKQLKSQIKPNTILRQPFQSATEIRQMLEISKHVPEEINNHFINYGFNNLQKFTKYLDYKLIITKDKENIFGANEGIENSKCVPSKRYTQSRINRFLLMMLLDIKKSDIIPFKNPPYLRILGMNHKGQNFLNKIKKDHVIITNAKEGLNSILDIELKASKIYALEYHFDTFKKEFLKPIIIK